jgi:hypothetical protein
MHKRAGMTAQSSNEPNNVLKKKVIGERMSGMWRPTLHLIILGQLTNSYVCSALFATACDFG